MNQNLLNAIKTPLIASGSIATLSGNGTQQKQSASMNDAGRTCRG